MHFRDSACGIARKRWTNSITSPKSTLMVFWSASYHTRRRVNRTYRIGHPLSGYRKRNAKASSSVQSSSQVRARPYVARKFPFDPHQRRCSSRKRTPRCRRDQGDYHQGKSGGPYRRCAVVQCLLPPRQPLFTNAREGTGSPRQVRSCFLARLASWRLTFLTSDTRTESRDPPHGTDGTYTSSRRSFSELSLPSSSSTGPLGECLRSVRFHHGFIRHGYSATPS